MSIRRCWASLYIVIFILSIYILYDNIAAGFERITWAEYENVIILLLLVFFVVVFSSIVSALVWKTLLLSKVSSIGNTYTIAVFLLGNIAKYVPGKIWSWGAQSLILEKNLSAKNENCIYASMASTIYLYESAVIIGGVIVSVIVNPWQGVWFISMGVNAISLMIIFFHKRIFQFLLKIMKKLRVIGSDYCPPYGFRLNTKAFLISLAVIMIYGVAGWLLALSLGFSSQSAFLAGLGVIIGDAAGLLAFISPGGLGVREAVIMFIFSMHQPPVGSDLVLVYSVAFRIMTTLADGLSAAWAGWYLIRYRNQKK